MKAISAHRARRVDLFRHSTDGYLSEARRQGLKLPPPRTRLADKPKAEFRKWMAMKMTELADHERKLYRRAELAKVALSYYPDMETAWAALAEWYYSKRTFTTFWQSATDKVGRYWLYRFWRKYHFAQ